MRCFCSRGWRLLLTLLLAADPRILQRLGCLPIRPVLLDEILLPVFQGFNVHPMPQNLNPKVLQQEMT